MKDSTTAVIAGSFFFPLIPAWIIVQMVSTSLSDFWEKMGAFLCWYLIIFSLGFFTTWLIWSFVRGED